MCEQSGLNITALNFQVWNFWIKTWKKESIVSSKSLEEEVLYWPKISLLSKDKHDYNVEKWEDIVGWKGYWGNVDCV